MNTRTTIILTIIAAGLAAYIFFFGRHAPTTEELGQRKGRILERFDRESAAALSITLPGQDPIRLEKQKGEWRIKSPRPLDADPAAIDSLLSNLDYLTRERVIEQKGAKNLTQFGFDRPKAQVTVEWKGESATVLVGAKAQEKNTYLALGGKEDVVYVVTGDVAATLAKGLDDLRSKEVLSIAAADVEKLRMKSGENTEIRIAREGASWFLEGPPRTMADDRKVKEITAELEPLKARRFVTDDVSAADLERAGLASPTSVLGVERVIAPAGKGGEAKAKVVKLTSIGFGGPCGEAKGEVYALIEGSRSVVCVSSRLAELMARPPESFLDLRPFGVRKDEVQSITLERKAGEVVLKQDTEKAGEWKVATPEEEAADPETVGGLLDRILASRAREMMPKAEKGSLFDSPDLRIELATPDAVYEVRWVAEKDRILASRSATEEVALVLAPGLIDSIRTDALAYRDKKVIPEQTIEASRIAIDGALKEVLVEKDGSWKVEKPVQERADTADVRELVDAIAGLKAVRYVSRTPAPEHGLQKPRVTLDLALKAEEIGKNDAGAAKPRTLSLLVGAETPERDGSFALVKTDKATPVFVLSGEALKKILSPHVDRTLLQVDDNAATKVVLVARGGARLEIEKSGDRWVRSDNGPLSGDAVKSALAKLATSRTLENIAYGPARVDQGLEPPLLRVEVDQPAEGTTEAHVVIDIGETVTAGGRAGRFARRAGVDATAVLPNDAAALLFDLVEHPDKAQADGGS